MIYIWNERKGRAALNEWSSWSEEACHWFTCSKL